MIKLWQSSSLDVTPPLAHCHGHSVRIAPFLPIDRSFPSSNYSQILDITDELAAYPEKWARLREEVLSTVGSHKAPTYDDLKNMRYLRYTLNETLRLYPAVPYNVRTALQVSTPCDSKVSSDHG